MVITGLTRNQLYLTVPWVRIPPSPPQVHRNFNGISVGFLYTAFGPPAALLGLEPCACPPGFEPLPAMVQVPLIGSIACGTPITAEQNIECYIGVPAAWHADFALTCHGDSMSPTICNGDIVCIRCQPEVEQGEIAAVRVGEEATLKHFHRQGDAVMLLADNAAVCPPMFYAGEQLSELHIEGKAVGLCRGL